LKPKKCKKCGSKKIVLHSALYCCARCGEQLGSCYIFNGQDIDTMKLKDLRLAVMELIDWRWHEQEKQLEAISKMGEAMEAWEHHHMMTEKET
jgi:hypothetical protein